MKYRYDFRAVIDKSDPVTLDYAFHDDPRNEWVIGNLKEAFVEVDGDYEQKFYITTTDEDYRLHEFPILPHTINQCTGLKDKNGKLIFEVDVLHELEHFKLVVAWCNVDGRYVFHCNGARLYATTIDFNECKILGNIHDNPELAEI
jgi:hypothetical protein